MKFLSLAITTVVFTVVAYLLFSFTAWSFDISQWSASCRFALVALDVLFVIYIFPIKKVVKI